jgi:hypothetical protein
MPTLCKSAVLGAAVVIGGMLTVPGLPAAEENPADFIRILGNQGLEVIRSGATRAWKASYFHQVLRQDFDPTDISRFVLGPYWRVASEGSGRSSAASWQITLCDFTVSGLRNMAATA